MNSTLTVIRRMTSLTSKSPITKGSPLRVFGATNFHYDDSPYPAVRLRSPGLTHESFDRDWNPKLASLMHTSSMARIFALHQPLTSSGLKVAPGTPAPWSEGDQETFLDWPRLCSGMYTFMSSCEFVMSRHLYDNSVSKWTVDMKHALGFVGNCSVAKITKFYSVDNTESDVPSVSELDQREPLWTNMYQMVAVDKTTRKACKLPDWFKEKYSGRGCLDKGLVFRPFDRPAVTYAHPLTVQWSDTDNYKHTNWATYIRWSTDALHAALLLCNDTTSYRPHSSRSGTTSTGETVTPCNASGVAASTSALKGITQEAVARGLRKMQVTYLRECLEGEHVDVHVWQEEGGDPNLVLYSVVKAGEDVCQLKMWYFDEGVDNGRVIES